MEFKLFALLLFSVVFIDAFDTRVIGGIGTYDGQYPFIVSLRRNDEDQDHFCGGSILNKNWILTAAHCVYNKTLNSFLIVAGTNKISGGGKYFTAEKIVIHEEFDYKVKHKDIAVVKVTEDFSFESKYISPIKLSPLKLEGGEKLTLLGWGEADKNIKILQQLNTNALSLGECQKEIKKVTEMELCAYKSEDSGMCFGDSGGPLILKGTEYQVGIVSYLIGCAAGIPDVYTRISAYTNWIQENINM